MGLHFDRVGYSIDVPQTLSAEIIPFEFLSLKALNRSREIENLINNIKVEHKKVNWDGYGANSVNMDSLNYAHEFLKKLKLEVPLPLGGCEPSGRVGIEWVTDRMRLTIGFNPDGSITYAGINQEGRIFSGRNEEDLDERIKYFLINNATSVSIP